MAKSTALVLGAATGPAEAAWCPRAAPHPCGGAQLSEVAGLAETGVPRHTHFLDYKFSQSHIKRQWLHVGRTFQEAPSEGVGGGVGNCVRK